MASARPRKSCGCGTAECPSRAAEEIRPSTAELMQGGDLLPKCQLCSGTERFPTGQTGLTSFSRKLPWPPKCIKWGESSTLQTPHSEDCRSICYKSSSPGRSRKHNFHKTLLNGENHPGLFFARCCTLPGALCDLSCSESK